MRQIQDQFCSVGVVTTLLVFVLAVSVASANEDDEFKWLVADYNAYGLPIPPASAELAVLKWSNCTVNGIPQYSQMLALVEPADSEGVVRYWIGCRREKLSNRVTATPAIPDAQIVKSTTVDDPHQTEYGFETYPDLAFSIQCASRGWHDLASALLARSRQAPQRRFRRHSSRPRDDRVALATLAWNYWCDQFCTEKDDRSKIVDRLEALIQGPHGLDTLAHRNIVIDMRQTLKKAPSPPHSTEAIIDSLVDFGIEGGWQSEIASLNTAARRDSYRTLESLGIEIVPVLLKHTHDFRLTRCVEHEHRGAWHIRIADVVLQLLNGLAGDEFAYDFRIREGRGKCVDRDHVLHWWTETKGVEAREYLRKNAITKNEDGEVKANHVLLLSLGREHPSDLISLFNEHVDQMEYADPLFEAIGGSSLSMQEKVKLFLKGVTSKNDRTRESAIDQLLKV